MSAEVAIVTGTRHRYHGLQRLVASVNKTASVSTEIVIADASDDMLYVEFPITNSCIKSIEIFHEFPRIGPTRGYNIAFRKAAGSKPRYVVYVNDDCEMVAGWDRIAIDFMDQHAEIGLGAIYFRDPGGPWNFQTLAWKGGKMCYANMGIYRREVGEQVDWFDEREVFVPALGRIESLKFYGNDTSGGLKVLEAGYGVVPIPGCKIDHHREPDLVRQENYRDFVHCQSGNTAGMVLWELWNGLPEKQAIYGQDYGYRQLQETHDRFRHLIPTSEYLQE
jgi:GT2 family glycosyltransferase